MVFLNFNLQKVASKVSSIVRRKKTEDEVGSDGPTLPRVLGLGDLTLLGVGSTLGVGVYVLAGEVAKNEAGPAVTISFLVAAIASAFAGLCYAEFAARVPKAGSAYVYSYVTVGELAAFVIGWNLILEYIIGTASVARAFSSYLDVMVNYTITTTLTRVMPINVSFLSPYPDLLAFGIILVLTGMLAYGVKESAVMNNLFTAINLLTVCTVIVAGSFKADLSNWSLPANSTIDGVGNGGFFPFGISGVMAGAAKCFFGFIGFDCVATTGEEAINPRKHIPLAIVISLLIIFAAYFGIGSVVTLMWPYYLEDVNAPLVVAFKNVGLPVISTIVSYGALFALCTSLLGCMLPAPRLLYSMAKDGNLWLFLSSINGRLQTPLKATLCTGLIAGIMGALFDLEQLINMMSIGTLLAYSIVALCVLILRYQDPRPALYEPTQVHEEKPTAGQIFGQIINYSRVKVPNKTTTFISEITILTFLVLSFVTTLFIVNVEDVVGTEFTWHLYVLVTLIVLTVLPVVVLILQPQDNPNIFFKVPWLPILPSFSIFMNIYLMMKLDLATWIRFAIWLFLGALIYVFYSIPHSVEGRKAKVMKLKDNSIFAK